MVADGVFLACKIGDINTVTKLANVEESLVDGNGACCLHYAARGGSVAVVEYLVKSRGFSVLARTKTGATALHDAAAKGNTAVVKWLVEEGGVDVNVLDGSGLTALHLAARYAHFLTVEWLLDEAGADASIRSNEGALPLHFAVVGGDVNCVKILVDENPRLVNMQMNNGAAPIYLASQAGHLEILQYLISRKAATKVKAYDAMSCLHAAAQQGHLDIVKWLVTVDKSNPNDRDFDGATPLHFAAGRGHADIVRWLLKEGGAKVTLDNLGGSPLHSAAEMGELQSIQALLDCGCDVDITDNAGLTAAELADKCDQPQAAALIRRQVTLADLGLHSSTLPANNEKPLLPSHLSFHPSSPAVSSKGFRVTSQQHSNFRTGNSQPPTSPPLPPPPAHPRSVASTPSTADSPISPPPPIHEDGIESLRVAGYGFLKKFAEVEKTERPSFKRTVSEVSVDSSASNFGVFEQREAGVVHTVTAEVHRTPIFVPPTPRPVFIPAVPGHGSLNSTQESIIYSTSSSSFSQEESSPVPIRKIVGQKTARFFEDFNQKGVSELHHRNHQHYPHRPSSPPLAHSTLPKKDPGQGSFSENLPVTPNKSSNNNNSSENDDSSYSIKSVREAVKEFNKFQYYSTPYKQDFNTVTKSSFAKAKTLFQYNQVNGTHICPDNGEICFNSERDYSPLNQLSASGQMDSPRTPEPESNSNKPVVGGVTVSNSGRSSETPNTMKSVIAIQGSHATIISTSSRQEKKEEDIGKRSSFSSTSKQTEALVTASSLETHKNKMLSELKSKNASEVTISGSSVAVVNGHAEALGHISGSTGTTRVAAIPQHLAVNGNGLDQNDRSMRQHSRSSSSSSTSSQPFSPVESKHNLIADIQSAVSGTSNLSLRRAKSKGEGVSMVYQSKKGGAHKGEVKTDSSPLIGQFDPKNFLDKVETVDATGRAVPEWRRHVLAKHLAEKAQKDHEEKKSVEDYEARFRDVPAWKRALIEKKEAQTRDSPIPTK